MTMRRASRKGNWRPIAISPEDFALVGAAIAVIKKRFLYSKHSIGAAVRTRSGHVFVGVNLSTYADHMAVCAESVAIGVGASWGDTDIDTIVAVRHPPPGAENQEIAVVAPCGACRERIFDYGSNARVIVPCGSLSVAVKISDLLPNKYTRPL